MNIKNKKLLVLSCAAIGIIAPLSSVSCSADEKQENKDEQNQVQNKVIFSTAQGEDWPLMRGIKPLVDEYNKTQNTQEGFVEVELQTAEDHFNYEEIELLTSVKTSINEKSKIIPNIILGQHSGAYIISQYDRLLDMNENGINKTLFHSKINKLHSQLIGNEDKNSKLYSLPFDISDTDGLTFNLDLMNKIFEIVKAGGGNVDEKMPLYEKALKASTTGTSIPAKSIFNYIEAKSKTAFKDLNVNAKTFESLKSVRDFVKAFHNGIKFNKSSVDSSVKNGSLLAIDYQEEVFQKELASISNEKLWTIDSKGVDYTNILENKEVQDSFKNLWNDWNSALLTHDINVGEAASRSVNNSLAKKTLSAVSYKQNGASDWASYDIRTYDTAIAYAASVGRNYSMQSPWSKGYFKPDADTYASWASLTDVEHQSQLIKSSENGKKVYWEGGSSLIAIRNDNENLNTGTIKFLNWLYTGQINKVPNWIYFAQNTGYIIPYKEVLTNENLKLLKQKEQEEINKWKEDMEKNASHLINANNYHSAIVSLNSILKYIDKDAEVIEAKNNYNGDWTSFQIISEIKTTLLNNSSKNIKEKTNGERMLSSLIQIINNN
ncbi:P68 family surface lipoprotein [Mycoplasma phocoenae]|uniref:Mycoplasma lipoprotein C-terminal domain-containing protein n=1 Tax=Mycoplasma phocoenae TaxID=754517 RepID=A0A858U4T8_9MOLU|nr:hypothetical protein [Mycoplasma phocoenae]QJG67061.1 hypothetical protein HGG69_01885 [Mycoplasma phocoenae]